MSHIKGGLIVLKEMIHSLPPSEKKIAKYILENPKEAILLTSMTLGEKSETSSAAVMRLCKSLGFSGFQELKIRVAGDLQSDPEDVGYRDIEPNESYSNIIEKVTSNTIQTIKETADITSVSEMKNAVKALINAKSIVFIGFGASTIAAQDAEQKFTRIDKNAVFYPDIHLAATAIATKGKEDVVVGISFSGHTEEVVKLLKLAKSKQVKTISITKYGHSPVTNIADINLYTSTSKEATFRSGATSSRIAQLHIIDILFMCLASEDYEDTIKYLDETREAISFLNGKTTKKN
ncbi:MurR/RpiR family transcriptional regulator [Pseudogracilibacillus auburnensis]|uniref:RpiR family transcriptional regulator n=1 Tax=Pseudogracilibacillus auburnensis TaxID=1494959 RepID=A0A2V3VXZ4_9BACI|nr:MurR/RpiR family transcriptional regulator [Pseudogracilibacillus auburnensis]MBO1004671.1 MurR/RpiR family transcriptional regulator [Pseudogracilibacillus auburnensis]PXW85578.1 RpiR family transcriptional regulator [Pseudogracilibacillus auburnensis]